MLYIIRRTSVFIVIFLVSYLSVIFFLSNVNKNLWYYIRKYTNIPAGVAKLGGNSLLRFREIENFENIDILFVGSSHCYRGFDPRFFKKYGIESFNMGSTAQSPLNSYYLLKKYMDRLKPKLLIFDLYWGVMEGDGTESFLDLASNVKFSRNLIKMTFATRNIIAINGLLWNIFNLNLGSVEKISPKLGIYDKYISGGFVETTHFRFNSDDEIKPRKIKINPLQLKYISKIIKMTKRKNVEIILVTSPISEKYLKCILNYDEWKSSILSLAKEHKVRYTDFNVYEGLNSALLFYDLDHFNRNGVKEFNKRFYNELLKDSLK